MKSKHLLLTLLLALVVPWAANAQTVTIGTGTSAHNSAPIANYYNYSICEMLFTSAEIGSTDVNTILSIGFEGAAASSKTYGITVYMKNVDATGFSANTDYIQVSASDVVYTGSIKPASGWNTIELATPFTYDNTKSLLVVVNKTSGGYDGFTSIWKYTSMSSPYMMLYGQNDSNPGVYNPTTLTSLATSSERPNVQLTFGTPPTCFAPQNLTCTEHTATSATLTWQRHASGTETAWVLQYSTDNTFATGVQSFNVSNTPSKELTGLTAEQTYYARVRPDCDENLWSDVCEFKPTAAQTVTIGDGTSTGYYLPVNTFYYYSLTQQIYTAEEITAAGGTAGTISSISFYHAYSGTATMNGIKAYLLNTDKAAFANNTDMVPVTESDKVWEGNITLNGAGWVKIDFTTPFDYDGGNLIVCMYYPTYEYPGSSYVFRYTATTNYTSVSYYSDNTNPDLNNINTFGGNKEYKQHHNNIQLGIIPSNTPKPRNLVVSDITSSGATVSWQAPASATPTSYQYQYKEGEGEWTALQSTTDLSVALSLSASKTYTFQVRAKYDGVGESDFVETSFTTLDDCAYPTNLLAYTVPGQGTKATLTWVKGYDETAWVLEYATNNTFTEGLVTMTDGFTVEGNNVTANLTGLTAETKYYARVKANCDGPTSAWSNVAEFTPTNYVDFPYNANATSATSTTPFYGGYAANGTHSRFIIPSTSLADLAGGTVKKLTFYSSATTADWGDATFKVYVAEVEASSFTSNPSTSTPFDWSDMTEVYSGSLSLANGEMVILLDEPFVYSGTKNLMIGFEETNNGTNATAAWYYKSGVSNSCAYAYKTSANATNFSTSRNSYSPKMTFNYLPTPYQKVAAINEGTIAATSAELTWTAPETTATITGYAYQYKLSSAAEWPTAWSNLAASATSVTLDELTSGSSYDFRIKVLYEGNHESAVTSTSFFTDCEVVTAFPWKEDFEAYATGDFSHPCWVNEHISGDGTNIFKVYTSANGSNTTHQLQLPDQFNPTYTKLRLPEMTLPNNGYQFVIDVYRSHYSTVKPGEGITVYASADGNLEGATKLAFIPRQYDLGNDTIPAVETPDWYTYELPIPMSGTCYIVLQGKNEFGQSTYMDNLGVEEIPTCARPKDLAYSNVTNHSAKLSWTAGDTEQTLWQVAYSKTSFDPNTANFDVTTVSTVDATANPFVLAGLLDAASTYYVYVRANCGTATEPDYGPWCRKGVSFTTLAATPAPSNFVASNPASAKVDLVWAAGGGDFESWELYYVKSETAPEAPTATTTATVTNITTLPTTEEPYVLDELDPVSKYYAWIRAKHVWNSETTYSDWVALTGGYFETLDACPTPTDLVATNLTSVSADLSWVGSDDVDSYTVEYGQEGTYSVNETEDFSDQTPVSYSATGGELPEGWYSYNTSTSGYAPRVSNNSNYSYISGLTGNFLLMTTNAYNSTDPSANQYAYAIMPQYSNLGSVSFDYQYENTSYGTLTVGYVTNNEGYTTYQMLETPTKASGKQTWSLTATHIATINNANGYVAFRYESGNGTYYSVGIDNVKVKGGTYTPGATQTVQSEETSITLGNLTPNKTYIAKVKSNCTNGEWSAPIDFTTLAEGNMVFTNATNDGKWGNSGNWAPAQLPVLTDEVILRANATIESGCVAEAKKINLNSNTLTIADGGQLKTDNTVTATVKKNIAGYEGTNDHYYLIGNPLSSSVTVYNSDNTYNIRKGTYDLYSWSRTSNLEWTNYGSTNTSSLSMSNGTGYLYANAEDRVITFTGTVKANNTDVTMNPYYTAPTGQTEFSDWNLYANPFVCDAYINDVDEKDAETPMAFYRMNEQGDGYVAATGAIHPMEGIFVQATKSSQSFKFSREYKVDNSRGQLNINLSKAGMRGVSLADNAIVRFGEGSTLEKFSFRENSSKVYIPMEGKDYAVVNAGQTGEIPVSFKAEKNGSYTLSFSNENVEFSYLHLIDNMTGMDVDLLANPSYSFEAKTTDYASRFKLVFATGSNANDESFAFMSDGNLIVNNEGEATLQVIDVNGRILRSERINGSASINMNTVPGVYMIRVINGENVKTQKMVVR